jgi:hypothetical protein
MRISAWSTGVGVLVIAFPITVRSVLAEAPIAAPIASATKSATISDLWLDRNSGTLSHSGQPVSTVALPHTTKVGFPKGSMIHPKPPKIHTRPKKKKGGFWPFGRK